MPKAFYTSAARQDLIDILNYIAQDKPEAAVSWLEKIETKCLLIASQPEMGELQVQFGENVRSNVVGRYLIFHRKRDESIEILRIIPGGRNITSL